jgi:hypothetical protein
MNDHWLVRPGSLRLIRRSFIAILVLTVLAELMVEAHPHFALERLFGFNALYGFLSCAALIAIAKALGFALKRRDTYYDE